MQSIDHWGGMFLSARCALCNVRSLAKYSYGINRIQAGVILMKLCFATGVLTIPSAFAAVGYVPGILLLLGWGAITTCELLRFSFYASFNHHVLLAYSDPTRLCIRHVYLPYEAPRCPQHRRCSLFAWWANRSRNCELNIPFNLDVSV